MHKATLFAFAVCTAVAAGGLVPPAHAQAVPEPTPPVAQPATDLSNDPDFLGGTRLFSAWLDHQVSYRGLPGVMVGVVHD